MNVEINKKTIKFVLYICDSKNVIGNVVINEAYLFLCIVWVHLKREIIRQVSTATTDMLIPNEQRPR